MSTDPSSQTTPWNGRPPGDAASQDGWHWLREAEPWNKPEPCFWYADIGVWRGKGNAADAARFGISYLGPCPEPINAE